jgi:hypothetical protein
MKAGASLALIGLGAILAFAVTANTSFFNVHTAGYVCIIIGIVGLYLRRRSFGRPLLVRRSRTVSGPVGERDVPQYVIRTPGTTPARAGLPTAPTAPTIIDPPERQPVPDLPSGTEVVEEEYFEE